MKTGTPARLMPHESISCILRGRQPAFGFLLALALMACSLPCKVLGGEVVYQVGFEEAEDFSSGYALGPLAGQGERLPAVTGWAQQPNEEFAGADVVEASAVSQFPAPKGRQMLQVRYDSGNPAVFQSFLQEPKAIKQDLKVTFLLAVDGPVSGGTFTFAISSSSGLNSGAWFGIRRAGKDDNSFGFFYRKVDAEGKSVWERIGEGVFEAQQFYKVELLVDYGNQTYGGLVTDASGGEVLKFSGLPLFDQDGHMSAGRGFNRLYIGADQVGTRPAFLVDDISVELAP